MSDKPTDDEILAAVVAWGETAVTYVIRNRLGRHRVTTPWVLRQMKRLEREGRVKRMPSPYAVMLTWGLATPASDPLK